MTAVDPDERSVAIAKARSRRRGMAFLVASAEDLPLPDGSVDATVSSVSAHHWTDVDRGLWEVARVLRPGGRFVLAELRPARGLASMLRRGHADHAAARDVGAWRRLLVDAGFCDVTAVAGEPVALPALLLRAHRADGEGPPSATGAGRLEGDEP